MSLDPVVELGCFPVPNIQLSISVSRHHVAGREETVQREKAEEDEMISTLLKLHESLLHLPKGGCQN